MATSYTDYNYSLLTGLIQNHAFWTSPMCFRQDNGPASKKLQCQWYYILTSRTVDNAYISADWWIRELPPILGPVHITPQKFQNATFLYGLATLLENGVFRKRWLLEIFVICVLKFSSNTNPKWPMLIVASSSSSGVVWTEIIYYAFTVRTLFSNCSGVVWTKP